MSLILIIVATLAALEQSYTSCIWKHLRHHLLALKRHSI